MQDRPARAAACERQGVRIRLYNSVTLEPDFQPRFRVLRLNGPSRMISIVSALIMEEVLPHHHGLYGIDAVMTVVKPDGDVSIGNVVLFEERVCASVHVNPHGERGELLPATLQAIVVQVRIARAGPETDSGVAIVLNDVAGELGVAAPARLPRCTGDARGRTGSVAKAVIQTFHVVTALE